MKQGKAWIEEVFVTDSLFAAVVYSCKQMTLQNCRGPWVPPIDHVQNFNLFQRCKRSFQSISCLLGLKMKERHHSLAVLYMPDHLLCELLQKNTFVPVSWTLSRISRYPVGYRKGKQHLWKWLGDLWPSQWLAGVSDTRAYQAVRSAAPPPPAPLWYRWYQTGDYYNE